MIQTGLQCGTNYYISVIVTGKYQDGIHPTLRSRQMQVLVEGKEIVWFYLSCCNSMTVMSCTAIPILFGVTAEVTADNTSIRVSWKWSCQGVLDLVRVHYQPEGGSLMMYTVDNTTATSATLSNLQCNTEYTIWVLTRSGGTGRGSPSRAVSLPARSMIVLVKLLIEFTVLYHPSPSHSH